MQFKGLLLGIALSSVASQARAAERITEASPGVSFEIKGGQTMDALTFVEQFNKVMFSAFSPESVLGKDGSCFLSASELRPLPQSQDIYVFAQLSCQVYTWNESTVSLDDETLDRIVAEMSRRSGTEVRILRIRRM